MAVMTARRPYDPDAGPWVAFRDVPARHGAGTRRHYLREMPSGGVSTTVAIEDTIRFDTKAEALAATAVAWPHRAAGCRKGAERVPS